jgi:hypothetical protein
MGCLIKQLCVKGGAATRRLPLNGSASCRRPYGPIVNVWLPALPVYLSVGSGANVAVTV